MNIELTPELGVELTPDINYIDLRKRAEAMCNSATVLDLDAELNAEASEAAATLTAAYAENPEQISKMVTTVRASTLTPASLKAIRNYLDEYGRQVVTHAVELRHLVTNRLIEESQNPDPRVRIRALELLGKHSDVGLFSEKQEVTVTHQTTDELKEKLRAKLQKLIRKDTEPEDAVVIGGEVIDVDAELGFAKPKTEVFVPDDEDVDPDNPDKGDDRG
jgi:F0F1-type ATP synthase delta subunit